MAKAVDEGVVEQIISPTGLVDTQVVVKPTAGQIDDLIGQIRGRVERNERYPSRHANAGGSDSASG